jgi:hypothetical protein
VFISTNVCKGDVLFFNAMKEKWVTYRYRLKQMLIKTKEYFYLTKSFYYNPMLVAISANV